MTTAQAESAPATVTELKPKPTGLALLRAPFPENQVSKMCRSTKKENPKAKCDRCGGYHGQPSVQLTYVGHAALTDRLLDADPAWYWRPLAVGPNGLPALDVNGGMWIRLVVCGVERLGYGDAQNRPGGDGVKEMIGDALRNAAMRFGAALDLWHKGDLHVDDDAPPAKGATKKAAPKGDDAPPKEVDWKAEIAKATNRTMPALVKRIAELPDADRQTLKPLIQERMAALGGGKKAAPKGDSIPDPLPLPTILGHATEWAAQCKTLPHRKLFEAAAAKHPDEAFRKALLTALELRGETIVANEERKSADTTRAATDPPA